MLSGGPLNAASTSTRSLTLLLSQHAQRGRNSGAADWLVRARGVVIAYNWPDGDDATKAVVVSAWRE
jgi:hypothetical protein